MPVSRKNKSLKKSSKTNKNSKNSKRYKSKTRKNINKLRGGEFETVCETSKACFTSEAASFIKNSMRSYFTTHKKNKISKDEENEIKNFLYLELYKYSHNLADFDSIIRGLHSVHITEKEKDLKNEIEAILEKYFNYKDEHTEINYKDFNNYEINKYANYEEIYDMIDTFIEDYNKIRNKPIIKGSEDAGKKITEEEKVNGKKIIKEFIDEKYRKQLGEPMSNYFEYDINDIIRNYFVIHKDMKSPIQFVKNPKLSKENKLD
jgi:hypothetical protein